MTTKTQAERLDAVEAQAERLATTIKLLAEAVSYSDTDREHFAATTRSAREALDAS